MNNAEPPDKDRKVQMKRKLNQEKKEMNREVAKAEARQVDRKQGFILGNTFSRVDDRREEDLEKERSKNEKRIHDSSTIEVDRNTEFPRRGQPDRQFRTTYAFAAPDYHHFETLGLGSDEHYQDNLRRLFESGMTSSPDSCTSTRSTRFNSIHRPHSASGSLSALTKTKVLMICACGPRYHDERDLRVRSAPLGIPKTKKPGGGYAM